MRGCLPGRDSDRPGLRGLPLPARLLVTLFLLGASSGLAAGEWDVLVTVGAADGEPGLSMEDVRRTFHGRPGWTVLGSKVDGGSMERHVGSPSEKGALVAWAAAGGRREEFEAVRGILDRRCVRCHSPGGEKEDSPFAEARASGARFDLVARHAVPDRGMTPSRRATTTHAHLFAMSALFALMGGIFLFADVRRGVKAAAVVLPFAGMFVDIGSWWLCILSPAFAWTVVLGGAMVAAGTLVLVARPLWEMWGPDPGGLRV